MLAAFLEGNATANESKTVLCALADDAELRELFHISQHVDIDMGLQPNAADYIPMTAIAAWNAKSLFLINLI